MDNELIVRKKRELGTIISDAFRLIFRNLKPISYVLALYVFLPFSIAFIGFFMIQANMVNFDTPSLIIGGSLFLFFGIIATIHLGLICFSILRAGQEMDANEIDTTTLLRIFKGSYTRNLLFWGATTLFSILIFGVIGLLFYIQPFLGGLIGVVFVLFLMFYLYPIILYAYRLYLEDKTLSYSAAFQKGRLYTDSYWGSSIGVYFISGIVSNFVQYTFIIPFSIIALLLGTVTSIESSDSMMANPLMMAQYASMALGFSYLFLFGYLTMFLKSYDIEEKLYGNGMLEKIDKIGTVQESFFDNEGSY